MVRVDFPTVPVERGNRFRELESCSLFQESSYLHAQVKARYDPDNGEDDDGHLVSLARLQDRTFYSYLDAFTRGAGSRGSRQLFTFRQERQNEPIRGLDT